MNIRKCPCNNCMIERGKAFEVVKYCATCNAYMEDGHDCDNCAYCGTDN